MNGFIEGDDLGEMLWRFSAGEMNRPSEQKGGSGAPPPHIERRPTMSTTTETGSDGFTAADRAEWDDA